MRILFSISLFVIFSAVVSIPAHSDNVSGINVVGLWLTADGAARVQISDCGDGTPCGTVVWVDPNQDGSATDDNNPDPELKGQNIVGSKMLWGFKSKKDKWGSGKIYDARDGKTYKSKLKLAGDDRLEVKGCVGPFCKTLVWTKVIAE